LCKNQLEDTDAPNPVISNPPPEEVMSVAHERFITLNLCSPMEMTDEFVRHLENFARTVKFSKMYVCCKGIRAYCVGKFGKFTVGVLRKIRSGKLHHQPFYFSFLSTF
jgi:hypothetical protein